MSDAGCSSPEGFWGRLLGKRIQKGFVSIRLLPFNDSNVGKSWFYINRRL